MVFGVALKIGKAIICWCFFPTDAGDFTYLAGFFSLMWEILHACWETGRNGVQAGDSLSMRESWKPWFMHGCRMPTRHFGTIIYNQNRPGLTVKNSALRWLGPSPLVNDKHADWLIDWWHADWLIDGMYMFYAKEMSIFQEFIHS